MKKTKPEIKSRGRRENHHRVQVEVTPELLARLETMRKRTDAQTMKQFLLNAIGLYQWVIEQTWRGKVIGAADNDEGSGFQELVSPVLMNIERKDAPSASQ